jgi:hypothetical protein
MIHICSITSKAITFMLKLLHSPISSLVPGNSLVIIITIPARWRTLISSPITSHACSIGIISVNMALVRHGIHKH